MLDSRVENNNRRVEEIINGLPLYNVVEDRDEIYHLCVEVLDLIQENAELFDE